MCGAYRGLIVRERSSHSDTLQIYYACPYVRPAGRAGERRAVADRSAPRAYSCNASQDFSDEWDRALAGAPCSVE